MAQPVVDTLRLSSALQEAGVERAQAEGVARALGDEFGEHVVARGDLDAGFARVEGEFKDVRAQFREVDAQFKEVHAEFNAVRADMAVMQARMDSGFEVLRGSMQALDSKFRYMMAGIGLVLAFLSAIAGLAVFQRIPSNAGPVPHTVWPGPAPVGAASAPETPAPANVRADPSG